MSESEAMSRILALLSGSDESGGTIHRFTMAEALTRLYYALQDAGTLLTGGGTSLSSDIVDALENAENPSVSNLFITDSAADKVAASSSHPLWLGVLADLAAVASAFIDTAGRHSSYGDFAAAQLTDPGELDILFSMDEDTWVVFFTYVEPA